MAKVSVKTGPLKNRKFDGLLDLMGAQDRLQETCKHRFVEVREVVSGMATDQPHYTVALVCKRCRKVLESQRVPVSHRFGKLLRNR
jgi:hypothetical protein